eukprot:TRINITY_DN7753_c0_g2_i1.p1 TRINITY_DN7753_c0_g2~~TRINITY_DN7753_c0_g2_i1.p1  ORF type:complete len:260 (+),score=38.63 TRINITY_DN7753_c0_g2_i1:444-1223(+)
MTANGNKEMWGTSPFYPMRLVNSACRPLLQGLGVPLPTLGLRPAASSDVLGNVMQAAAPALQNFIVAPQTAPRPSLIFPNSSAQKESAKLIEALKSSPPESHPARSENASTFLSKDPVIDTTLKLILHESSSLFSKNLILDQTTSAKVRFRLKWQSTIADLISLADFIQDPANCATAIEQYKKLSLHEVAGEGASFTLAHCYLLKNQFAESFTAYKRVFFGKGECSDVEQWYIVGILYLSLIHICRCRRYAVCRSRWSP